MRCVPLLLLILLTGCFGGSQNPSYFPWLMPAGDVIRTHAKPPGFGYFRNFDPKACKIEITPQNAMNPTRTQVVLLATVTDKDSNARRKRRVEWQLEGPGTIVEVDESGWLAGRGYLITDKLAVSYTDYQEHTITRGNDDPRDDFTVCPGQTWCVVSCPVDGQTVVTAYAPEVFDWNQRRAFAKLVWTDGGFLPVRSGRETDSSLNERAKAEATVAPGLLLDVKLAKSVPVNRESTATVKLANSGLTASASATVRAIVPDNVELIRTEPAPTRQNGRELYWTLDSIPGSQSRDFKLVFKPVRNGPVTVMAFADTTDGLTASTKAEANAGVAAMTASLEPNAFYSVGEKATVKLTVTNTGAVPIENAVAWVTPGGALSTSGNIKPSSVSVIDIEIGTIAPGQSRTLESPVYADKVGTGTLMANVTADGGLTARAEATAKVGRSELVVKVVGPESIPLGESGTYQVQVANAGDVAAKDINIRTSLPRGMVPVPANDTSISGDTAAWNLTTLAPGEQKVFRLTARGDRLSELGSISTTASGLLTNGAKLPTAKTTAPASVRGQPILTLEARGPVTLTAGGKASFKVEVKNRGNSAARDLVLTANASPEWTCLAGNGPKRASVSSSQITFAAVEELAANSSAVFTIELEATNSGDAKITFELASRDLTSPVRDEQATRITGRK